MDEFFWNAFPRAQRSHAGRLIFRDFAMQPDRGTRPVFLAYAESGVAFIFPDCIARLIARIGHRWYREPAKNSRLTGASLIRWFRSWFHRQFSWYWYKSRFHAWRELPFCSMYQRSNLYILDWLSRNGRSLQKTAIILSKRWREYLWRNDTWTRKYFLPALPFNFQFSQIESSLGQQDSLASTNSSIDRPLNFLPPSSFQTPFLNLSLLCFQRTTDCFVCFAWWIYKPRHKSFCNADRKRLPYLKTWL